MFEFANVWILLLLPLPWLVRALLPAATPIQTAALSVPFYHRIKQLTAAGSQQHQHGKTTQLITLLIWLTLLIAAAGPQWLGPPKPIPQQGRNIMLALDLSGSMQLPDMKLKGKRVDRLTIVKAMARKFINQRIGDKVGLIVFGSRAYLQTPLTFDRKTVQLMLNDATIGLAGKQTALGDAIGLAIKRLEKVPTKSRILILLTDGANNTGVLSPIQAAKLAAQDNIKIYTIGIGANSMMVPGFFGAQMINPSADLDEGALQKIAKLTGGLFFRAKNTAELQKVYRTIDKLEPVSQSKTLFRPVTPYYYWPLSIAFLLSLWFALSQLGLNFRVKSFTHPTPDEPEAKAL